MIISTAMAATADGHAAVPFYQTPDFWLAITFVILVLISIRPLVRGVNMAMIIRAAKIKKKIVDAKVLRVDTEKLLYSYLQKQEQVGQEMENILSEARKNAERLRESAEESLKESMKAKEKDALNNIQLMEKMALADIRARVTDITLSVAQSLIEKQLSQEIDNKIINKFSTNLYDTLDKMHLQ